MVNRSAILLLSLLLAGCTMLGLGERPADNASASEGSAFDRFYLAGKNQMAANRVGLAIVDFERALALDPRSVKTLNALGACYDGLHRYDIAMSFYKQALAIEPQSADTLNNMAVSLAMAGFPTDAEYMLRKAASLDPENQTIQVNIAGMNSLGTAHAMPKRGESQVAVSADSDPKLPHVERIGLQAYMLYIGKKASPKISNHSAAPISHKLKVRPGALRNGRSTVETHHARLLRSHVGHQHDHRTTHPVGIATNIRLHSSRPDQVRNAHRG